MGFLDSVQSSFNRGTETIKLKAQMESASKCRKDLMTQLGESLYEQTRGVDELRAGREALYDGIAAADEECARCQAEIDRLEAEARAEAAGPVCPNCGSPVEEGDAFCMECGHKLEKPAESELIAELPVSAFCPNCGVANKATNKFCKGCGFKLI